MGFFNAPSAVLPSISEVLPAVRTYSASELWASILTVLELETPHPDAASSSAVAVVPSSAPVLSDSRASIRGVGAVPVLSTDSESQGGETNPTAEKESG